LRQASQLNQGRDLDDPVCLDHITVFANAEEEEEHR